MKVSVYLRKIKKFGIRQSIVRGFGMAFYPFISRCYKAHLKRTAKVDPKQILFYSTPSFSDNAKIFFEYMQKACPGKYHYIWMIHREDPLPDKQFPDTEFIKADSYSYPGYSFQALRSVATSRYVFFTHASPLKEQGKVAGQLVVNLWHGCGYKDREASKKSGIELNPFDLALVPGEVFIKTKEKFWGCDASKILPIGYPRYDLLHRPAEKAERFCDSIRQGADKLIVWFPTFRVTGDEKYPEEKIQYAFELPLLQSMQELVQLNAFCQSANIVICIKRHPKQVVYQSENANLSNIRFISNADLVKADVDLYSIFQYTDALISDYSSASVDYLLLDKPMAFSLDDFEQYQQSRGFVFEDPRQYMPGHHLYKLSDLEAFITDVAQGKDMYADKRRAILPQLQNPCEQYCARVMESVGIS